MFFGEFYDFGTVLGPLVGCCVFGHVLPIGFYGLDELGQIIGAEVAVVAFVGAFASVAGGGFDLGFGDAAAVQLGDDGEGGGGFG